MPLPIHAALSFLEARSLKGGSGKSTSSGGSSKGKSKGGGSGVVVVGAYNGGHSSGHSSGAMDKDYAGLPLWAWIIIAVIVVILVIFVIALIHHIAKERRLAKQHNRRPSMGSAIWKAAKIALFLWIVIELAKCCCGGRKRKTGNTAYRQVGSAADVTAANNNSNTAYNSWYGSAPAQQAPPQAPPAQAPLPAGQAYGEGGAGYRPSEKYEPMGNNNAGSRASQYDPPPYTANSAYQYPPTAYAPTTMYPNTVPVAAEPQPQPYTAPGPQYAPAPAATQTAAAAAPATSATYVPGQNSYPLY